MKTNAARILDALGLPYEMRQYEVDEEDLSAPHVAAQIGFPSEQVFKTLVLRGDKQGILVLCLPGSEEVNLKRLAAATGNKKVDMVAMKEIQPLTGYIRGGVSPLGMKKKYPVFLAEEAWQWPVIVISAGLRGYQIILAPAHLEQAVQARTICLTEK